MTQLRIGDIARLGGVSVRMLRHYHEIGLLVPARVDPQTGYRLYDSGQLVVLRRIAELRKLGVALSDIADAVTDRSDAALRRVLSSRRADLVDEIATATSNLGAIDRQLAGLAQGQERKDTPAMTPPAMNATNTPNEAPTIEVELKPIPQRLVAQLTGVAESWEPTDIGPVIQPLYPELLARIEQAGVEITGPSTAWYEDTDEGRVLVHATLTIDKLPTQSAEELGFEVIELPAIELAATTVHRGTMDNCDDSYVALLEWIEAHGHVPVGYSRELDIECGPDNEWVTELQQELRT